jgi:hypothetical protein
MSRGELSLLLLAHAKASHLIVSHVAELSMSPVVSLLLHADQTQNLGGFLALAKLDLGLPKLCDVLLARGARSPRLTTDHATITESVSIYLGSSTNHGIARTARTLAVLPATFCI